MAPEIKKFSLEIAPGQSMKILDEQGVLDDITETEETLLHRIGDTMAAYFKEVEKLLEGRFDNLREFLPTYLTNPGRILLACCSNGLVIRFDRREEEKRQTLVSCMRATISDAVAILSNNLIHLHEDDNYEADNRSGIDIFLESKSAKSGAIQIVPLGRIRFDAVLKRPEALPAPPQKPFCLMSVNNTLEMRLHGLLVSEDSPVEDAQPIVTVVPIQLPVGWECIQVYPYFELEHWKPENALAWAERDILAAVTSHQIRENQLKTLDPNADARRQFGLLLRDFKALLDSKPEREEILQKFLKDHPSLLCPSYTKMWPKFPLGTHVTDFVFREAGGDYLLVELEPSTFSLFKKDGHPKAELNHALGQITDWKRYLEDNLSTVQRELGLTGISSNPRSLVVIGRSHQLTDANRRLLATLENERPKTKILTYDDVLENAKVVVENLLGPIVLTSGHARVFMLNR